MASSQSMRPYYAVIFTSRKRKDTPGYEAASQQMLKMVNEMPGFIHADSVRDEAGFGITVSYWENIEALKHWGKVPAHLATQKRGREEWYENFSVRIAQVIEENKS